MRMYLLALNPTDSVTEGFLPAAARLGIEVVLLTDQPKAHASSADRCEILACEVRDFRAVVTRIAAHRPADAVFTNSDHLQTQAALAAAYFGLPGKDWQAALRCKNKAEMRRCLAAAGVDTVRAVELDAVDDPSVLAAADLPYPCIVKPREGVASEDVFLAEGPRELVALARQIRARRPGAALLAEEYLEGELYTVETLGDGELLHILGGFHTTVSPPPRFIEERLDFTAAHSAPVLTQVRAQLGALGVGLGACHTEFILQSGRVRLVEVNYRIAGDHCDLLLADLLGLPLFELVLRTHLGEPLPRDLGAREGGVGRVQYALADRAGTLTAAPAALDRTVDGVRLAYRPLRPLGERHEHYGTNRDYLGILRATGTDSEALSRVAAEFFANRSWEITP
ncbi:hypothetical protein SLNWT_7249 [Streptomyces albus]|uniref:ATP-grasp domain-containing protein n=1 Tax=Streptomyces albus (strain ATCC 21838 / DSM 41398 / FERM P-419 / JCM 4703 / NBRC 107858) TaxID=1081613 RepID=A0A0B5F7T0_STRA4|nr:hypothetical protein SLNWT_7249 [Streptomyces albus]AOU81926.1 hypothetical protein SLNHY_7235 [Streptomyces albus]